MPSPAAAAHFRRWCALAAFALMSFAPAARAQDGSLEFAVKAAFLYKLGPFVAWPAHAFETPSAPVNLCIVGRDPFGAALDQAVAGQLIGARAIAIWRLAAVERGRACHILYIGTNDARVAAEVLAAVRGTPTLTVTDGIRDGSAKGIVNFVIISSRVRFEIDEHSAVQSGLEISSKVLSLAVSVRPRS